MTEPDARGYYGAYGGRFVPETLITPLLELEEAYRQARLDPEFQRTLADLLRDYVGRPTPLTPARRLSEMCGGAQIWLKREDLAHTGAHKINNALGQALLAQRMGKRAADRRDRRGAARGGHGHRRRAPGVRLRGLYGARRHGAPGAQRVAHAPAGGRGAPRRCGQPHAQGCHQRGAARLGAQRGPIATICSARRWGPIPIPLIVRDLQSVIGREARAQALAQMGRLPDILIACVGGGSNAIGLFHPFLRDPVRMIGVEAGGEGISTGRHAARFADPLRGQVGILHGVRTYVLQDEHGQIAATHSVSAGLDYPSVGPEHAQLHDLGRVAIPPSTMPRRCEAFQALSRYEGILPALESAHAVAEALRLAPTLPREEIILVNLSGRGDKDLDTVRARLEKEANAMSRQGHCHTDTIRRAAIRLLPRRRE